jgi:hypothetical protein
MSGEQCKYEKEWGQTQASIKTLFRQLSELREDVSCFEKQNIIIERLSVNFQHLVDEVKTSNTNFHNSLNSIDTKVQDVAERMTEFETADGAFWKGAARGWMTRIIEYIFIAGIGAIIGQSLLGG